VAASVFVVPAYPEEDPSTTLAALSKIKQTKARQLNQKKAYGKRLITEEDVLLANVYIARPSRYGVESMWRFWNKVRGRSEVAIDRMNAI
jgi:hypothetical protein